MPGPWPGPREGLGAMLKLIDELTYGNTQKPFSIGGDEYPAGTMDIGSVPGGPSDIKGLIGMAGRLKGLLGRGARAARGYHGSAPLAGSQGIPHTSPLPNQGPPVTGGAPPSGGGYADDAAGLMRGDIPPKPRMGADFQAMDDLGPMRDPTVRTQAQQNRPSFQGEGDPRFGGRPAPSHVADEFPRDYGVSLDGPTSPQRAEPQRVAEIYPYNQGSGFNPDDLLPMADAPTPGQPAGSAGYYEHGLPGGGGPLPVGVPSDPNFVMQVLDEFSALNANGQIPYEHAMEMMVHKYGDWVLSVL